MLKGRFFEILIGINLLTSTLSISLGQSITGKDYLGVTGSVRAFEENEYKAIKDKKSWIKDPELKDYLTTFVILDKSGMPLVETKFIMRKRPYIKKKSSITFDPGFPNEYIYDYSEGSVNKILLFSYSGLSTYFYEIINFTKVENGFKVLESIGGQVPLIGSDYMSNPLLNDTFQENKLYKYEWSNNKLMKIIGQWRTIQFEYDDKGNYTKRTIFDEYGNIARVDSYKYLEFDIIGNWTKRVVLRLRDLTPPYIQERKFTYY